ncbi:hypothetical protein XENORESO_004116 [Xenotaenia resolanae]|uniref:Uncharacterized protein n=1 Tax=Xenotaenia resolanae TaxID=208358 RepID=A0ABV0VUW4_9TELE
MVNRWRTLTFLIYSDFSSLVLHFAKVRLTTAWLSNSSTVDMSSPEGEHCCLTFSMKGLVVGQSWSGEAYAWRDAGGAVLGFLVMHNSSRPHDVTACRQFLGYVGTGTIH